jgi:hypothetical protein
VKRYIREVVLFLQFQSERGLMCTFPASIVHVSVYFSFLLGKQKVTAARASMAYAALIKWVHGLLPLQLNPLDSSICQNLIEAEKRQRKRPIMKKEPASIELIKFIAARYGYENATLKDLRLAALCVLSFAGLFRSKELLNIRVRDIKRFDDHFVVSVPESKTDIYRQGQDVFIARTNEESCPGALLDRYIRSANIIVNDSDVDLFRNVIYLKSTNSYTLGNKPVSYTRFGELFKDCLKELGYDEKLYGPHNFRSGGATTIARNLQASNKERLLKLHGRWK